MKKQTTLFCALLAALSILAACSSAPDVNYGDPTAVETVTIGFGSTDLQSIAEKMTQSLLASGVLGNGQKPVLYVAQVKNRTDEQLDTKNITDKISTALVRSARVRLSAAMESNSEIVSQLEHQNMSGLTSPETAKRYGKQVGADYFLCGEITSIRKQAGRVEDVYFKFTLKLVNIESGLIDWMDEKEIRKGAKKPVFGM